MDGTLPRGHPKSLALFYHLISTKQTDYIVCERASALAHELGRSSLRVFIAVLINDWTQISLRTTEKSLSHCLTVRCPTIYVQSNYATTQVPADSRKSNVFGEIE